MEQKDSKAKKEFSEFDEFFNFSSSDNESSPIATATVTPSTLNNEPGEDDIKDEEKSTNISVCVVPLPPNNSNNNKDEFRLNEEHIAEVIDMFFKYAVQNSEKSAQKSIDEERRANAVRQIADQVDEATEGGKGLGWLPDAHKRLMKEKEAMTKKATFNK